VCQEGENLRTRGGCDRISKGEGIAKEKLSQDFGGQYSERHGEKW